MAAYVCFASALSYDGQGSSQSSNPLPTTTSEIVKPIEQQLKEILNSELWEPDELPQAIAQPKIPKAPESLSVVMANAIQR